MTKKSYKKSNILQTDVFNVLDLLLRPPGEGLPVFSTGRTEHLDMQKQVYKCYGYNVANTNKLKDLWRKSLRDLIKTTKVVLIGLPLDTGAGIRRGASAGPLFVRKHLIQAAEYRKLLTNKLVLDVGDIYTNPHLLHDGMLNSRQLHQCRQEMYFKNVTLQQKHRSESLLTRLPVSPLSQLRFVLELLLGINPRLRFYIIGGDHSGAWPVSEVLYKVYRDRLGIVQSDAHTDLLESRLGINYCFGTWSFHANNLLKQNGVQGKMVQLGIGQTSKTKKYWSEKTGITQFWAQELKNVIRKVNEKKFLDSLVKHLKTRGVEKLYFTNDIDGTTMEEAPATGTPARNGLTSKFLLSVISRLGKDFEIVGADIMEVAPDLAKNEKEKNKTGKLAAKYTLACLKQQIR